MTTMRFLMMHKNDARAEAGEPPPMALIQKMGVFIGGLAGKVVDSAGLAGSKSRTRLTIKGGHVTIKHGPYRGEHELPANVLVLVVKTREEAIGWAERYGKLLGDGELELGKVNQPWDLGFAPVPPNAPLHMLLVDKADAASEGAGRSPQLKAAISRLKTEMTKAGVLDRSHALAPSAEGKRLIFTNHALRTVDGPFSESKELIGGFGVLDLSGWDEAIEQATAYAELFDGTIESDVRIVLPE